MFIALPLLLAKVLLRRNNMFIALPLLLREGLAPEEQHVYSASAPAIPLRQERHVN